MDIEEIENLLSAYNHLNLYEILDYDRFNYYAITHHSTVIEGSTLTENETRLLLEEDLTPKGKPLQHSLMVKDHYSALQQVMQAAKDKSAITVSFIQHVNALVMKNTGNIYNMPFGVVDAGKGEFRKGNVSAGGFYFINYDQVPAYTADLVKRININLQTIKSTKEKLEVSFAAHFDLVGIHPFYDGNGRTSRLLMNYLQALLQLPLAIVFKEDKADYFTSLQASRKVENIQPFFDFMFSQYAKHLQNEISLYEDNLLKKTKPQSGGLSILF